MVARHRALGAQLAPDGIPLHYGNQPAEWQAAQHSSILLDRSHEGRILLRGRDSRALVSRMSTNAVERLAEGAGCSTVFTNANARILFRADCWRQAEGALLISEPGQGMALADFLRRNIFYGDKLTVQDVSAQSAQFALHGPGSVALLGALDRRLAELPAMASAEVPLECGAVTVLRRTSLHGEHVALLCGRSAAPALHDLLLHAGAVPAGSLTYNTLRIWAGQPGRLELTGNYLPLEVGLWDALSFDKGCYTGQEIIARMESRQRLAKTLVQLDMAQGLEPPARLAVDGRSVGSLTSCAQAPDGQVRGLAVLSLRHCAIGAQLQVGEAALPARVIAHAGSQPPYLAKLLP